MFFFIFVLTMGLLLIGHETTEIDETAQSAARLTSSVANPTSHNSTEDLLKFLDSTSTKSLSSRTVRKIFAAFLRYVRKKITVMQQTIRRRMGRISDDLGDRMDKVKSKLDSLEMSVIRRSGPVCQKGMRYTYLLPVQEHLVYSQSPVDNSAIILCDPLLSDGGWVIIQKRIDGEDGTSFLRDWRAYAKGFGAYTDDFWLGNDKIAALTAQGRHELHIHLIIEGDTYLVGYSNFKVANKSQNYKLTISGHAGILHDAFSSHNGAEFSTYDKDNDGSPNSNCARDYGFGGWWYTNCYSANLNSNKWIHVVWYTHGVFVHLEGTLMLVR